LIEAADAASRLAQFPASILFRWLYMCTSQGFALDERLMNPALLLSSENIYQVNLQFSLAGKRRPE
jgi:hypothetical protein